MALPISSHDREFKNFKETSNPQEIARITHINSGLGTFLSGIDYDYCKANYPDATTEVYVFKNGGATGTVVATLTVIYLDASKQFIDEVLKT